MITRKDATVLAGNANTAEQSEIYKNYCEYVEYEIRSAADSGRYNTTIHFTSEQYHEQPFDRVAHTFASVGFGVKKDKDFRLLLIEWEP